MRSPFPGMDPYLEAHWLDVHPHLIVATSNRIQGQLAEGLVARIKQRLVVEQPMLGIESEPIVQRFIEITDLSTGGRVITVIEFVSPTNKLPGDGLAKHVQKQSECRSAG